MKSRIGPIKMKSKSGNGRVQKTATACAVNCTDSNESCRLGQGACDTFLVEIPTRGFPLQMKSVSMLGALHFSKNI